MKAIEIKARRHFKNVKAGEFKPTFSPDLAASNSALVWVGDVPLPLEVYYNYLASKNRVEARRLVRSPKSLNRRVSTQEKRDAPTTTEDLKPVTSPTKVDADDETHAAATSDS